ncbi:hypothetical protein [Fluviibacterium sp. S390]|uniref:hypothetical protein n=1 Tax=Fluviibacterium sp. S390 TaxID=3415139 RepID=UPI003C7D467D
MDLDPTVAPHESGVLRLYRLDTDSAEGAALRTALATEAPEAADLAAQAFGVASVDPWWLTLLPLSDIRDLGLHAYLVEGHDVPRDQLDAEAARLATLDGTLLIAQSRAFDGGDVTLRPGPVLTPLLMLDSTRAPATARPLARAKVDPVAVTPPTTVQPPQKAPAGKWMLAALLAAGLLVLTVALLGAGG